MTLTVNGKKEQIAHEISLSGLLRTLQIGEEEKGFAIAVNEEVIFRREWNASTLHEGDRVEIIRATQGG